MPSSWGTPPIVKVVLQLQQLTAKLQRLLLEDKLQRAKKLLEKQNGK